METRAAVFISRVVVLWTLSRCPCCCGRAGPGRAEPRPGGEARVRSGRRRGRGAGRGRDTQRAGQNSGAADCRRRLPRRHIALWTVNPDFLHKRGRRATLAAP